jgi:hypothetical protein
VSSELQAMKSGAKPRDEPLIDELLARRQQAIAASTGPRRLFVFSGLARRLRRGLAMSRIRRARRPGCRSRGRQERLGANGRRTMRRQQVGDVFALEADLRDEGTGWTAWAGCATRCNASPVRPTPTPTPRWQRARRLLRTITSGSPTRAGSQYRKLLEQYRLLGQARRRC